MLLDLEEVEQAAARDEAEIDATSPAQLPIAPCTSAARKDSGRHRDHVFPCCGQTLYQIGKDKAERLDIVPASPRVLVRRPKYACQLAERGSTGSRAIALTEERLPTEATSRRLMPELIVL